MERNSTLEPAEPLTPVQQAAIERIIYFKEEMAKKGIYVRSAMELEFTIMDEHGVPIPLALKPERIKLAERYLKDKIPHHIQRFGYEHIDPKTARPMSDISFEVNVIDNEDDPLKPYNPLSVATVTSQLKEKTLAEMLHETTYLNTAHECFPNFKAHPYPDITPNNIRNMASQSETSGLHINISLYDAQHRNLFAENLSILDHCVNSILTIQRDAALMMLPNENSLSRIKLAKEGQNKSVPTRIEMGYKKGSYSVAVRREKDTAHSVRIENRLPGADADPYVAMAITMAALFDVVDKHVHQQPSIDRQALLDGKNFVDKEETVDFRSYDIPDTYIGVVERFKTASRLKSLLGEKLYNAVISSVRQDVLSR